MIFKKIDKKTKLLNDIASVYDEIYALEKQRKELQKKINLKRDRLNAYLNTVRIDYKGAQDEKEL